MEVKKIEIRLTNSSADESGTLYWKLFKKYLSLFDCEIFQIPYVIIRNNTYVVKTVEFNLMDQKLGEICNILHEIESDKDFIGFQDI